MIEELERERSKNASLKLLVTAAEEREAYALREASNWKSKVDELVASLERMESQLSAQQEIEVRYHKLLKDLEKSKCLAKDNDRKRNELAEEFESSKLIWIDQEENLKSKLANVMSKYAELQKQLSLSPGTQSESDNAPSSPPSPEASPQAHSNAPDPSPALQIALESVQNQKAQVQAELRTLQSDVEQLKLQLSELQRVNGQLMDENESYQLLVGEKTLMGAFDLRNFICVATGEASGARNGPHHSVPSGLSSPSLSLSGVEEEDEEEREGEDAVEKAILESHGAGSRTSGAFEAGITKPTKAGRQVKRGHQSLGGGLDLAAELAQAEQSETAEAQRTQDMEWRQKAEKALKKLEKRDRKIEDLHKAIHALTLYIEKILKQIESLGGVEKLLSAEFASGGDGSLKPTAGTASANPTGGSAASGIMAGGFLSSITKSANKENDLKPLNLAHTTPTPASNQNSSATAAATRTSWLQSLFRTRSSTLTTSAAIKPLKLGTNPSGSTGLSSAGLSTGWGGVKNHPGLGDGEEEARSEEARNRERHIAEMKLYGVTGGNSGGQEWEASRNPADLTIRASRRSSSMYGPIANSALGMSHSHSSNGPMAGARKRVSADLIGQTVLMSTSPPSNLSPAGMMKRVEEREKESRENLSRGQASGFTEIEIRGSRLRPTSSLQRRSTTGNSLTKLSFPQSPSRRSTSGNSPPGVKELSMTTNGDRSGGGDNNDQNDGLFARTARRISLMRSS